MNRARVVSSGMFCSSSGQRYWNSAAGVARPLQFRVGRRSAVGRGILPRRRCQRVPARRDCRRRHTDQDGRMVRCNTHTHQSACRYIHRRQGSRHRKRGPRKRALARTPHNQVRYTQEFVPLCTVNRPGHPAGYRSGCQSSCPSGHQTRHRWERPTPIAPGRQYLTRLRRCLNREWRRLTTGRGCCKTSRARGKSSACMVESACQPVLQTQSHQDCADDTSP